MAHIIAGRFGTKIDAEKAEQSMSAYIDKSDFCIFHNNPPGQHGTTMFGDDQAAHHLAEAAKHPHGAHPVHGAGEAEQVDRAEDTAITTAAVAGVAAGVLAVAAGPVAALAAAGIAAYTGSLAGALGGSNEDSKHHAPAMRQGGVMIAVHITNPANQARVIEALHAAGAADIEQADGEWREGDWVDFDPLATPHLVALAKPHSL